MKLAVAKQGKKGFMIATISIAMSKWSKKMIETAGKQEKIRKVDENFSFNNLQNCTLNFNFN